VVNGHDTVLEPRKALDPPRDHEVVTVTTPSSTKCERHATPVPSERVGGADLAFGSLRAKLAKP